MPRTQLKPVRIALGLLVLAFGTLLWVRLTERGEDGRQEKAGRQPVPVEVANVSRGDLALFRTFSGTIFPSFQYIAAAKVSGRIRRLQVDIADSVSQGQLIVQLEDDEFKQAVIEAEARRAVTEATCAEAESHLEIARRELDRTKALHERGITSDSGLDSAQTEFLASQAAVKVADANLKREDAALAAARIRLGYTQIRADWEQGDEERTVAERYVDEGDTVAANTPLFSVVELDPVLAVIQVTERDYPRIVIGQPAVLHTDAFPGRAFTGAVSRIAPIFRESSRQSRVEIQVPNPDHFLKPGMFARCTLELERIKKSTSVPEMAITRRSDRDGIFLVTEDERSVKWIEVQVGLRTDEAVQLVGADFAGQVVVLGQQFLSDGSPVRVSGSHIIADGGAEKP